MSLNHQREYDIVLLGATGYTGRLTAEHIVNHLSRTLRWAIAGRSKDKLEKLASHCQTLNPQGPQPAIEVCNATYPSLSALAPRTACLITTLGPFARHGEPGFRACAESGTHYVDCTGEVPFTRAMVEKYEAVAAGSGARMVPQGGLESAPSDLLTWAVARAIREELGVATGGVVVEMHRLDSSPTGGTLVSIVDMFRDFPIRQLTASLKPHALSPVPDSSNNPKKSLLSSLTGLTPVPGLGLLSTGLTSALNAPVVNRTWGLTRQCPALHDTFYGPNFSYCELAKLPGGSAVGGMLTHYGLAATVGVLMVCPLARSAVKRVGFRQGEGPNPDATREDRIELRAVGEPDGAEGRAYGTFGYMGSMYHLTAALLAEAAMAILEEERGLPGGIYTPACLGEGYVDRLRRVGIELDVGVREV